ncbi:MULTISPECIES: SMC-Scp complex subunit ScpB [Micromonospora]|uniref:SMC-Scp complex subunit ScpB n=1 Tax=Micromonospora solifontis TaxID=2487138 RepID=A0ABX9WES4_9ACTN|nr:MULTISPECIES: SMC-Scp complex subunit ScpB [Micromonospora]NES16514.1 SMC-Scp complex subunit ScpB [Micromonospora sp. PPF5-17B]NES37440.1 SMC-Scp complex subunit ScpB [Micromonospora solifontis]NES58202.1 SMC-Scp complex subunit ScpB [Micromonospora sp. PPF5-6]RNL98352.1 SMC-Scp complex subunit ScpB [Micromonospora solifontis]
MSDEERTDSLADQAAAWVPPWERPAPPKPAAPTEPPSAAGVAAASEPAAPEVAAVPEVAAEPAAAVPEVAVATGEQTATVDSHRAAGTETVQDPTGESAAEPVSDLDAPPTGLPAGEGEAGGVPGKRGRRRAAPAPESAPELDDAELRGALEAILLVVDQPVSELTLAEVLEQSPERIGPMLDEIAAGYTAAGHGFELRRAAGGWRLYTRPEYATYVERFVLDGQSVRLTQAALETLAVIAYKQPVTRSRISAIRGVNCDGVIRTLVGRGLVEECGTEADSGAFLYRTTTMFLEKLGLNSVDDLPPLAPFLPDDVEELADATR